MRSKPNLVNKKGVIFLPLLNLSPSCLLSLCECSILCSDAGGFMTFVLLEAENSLLFTLPVQNICKSQATSRNWFKKALQMNQ